jgi:hypothetical protein
VLLHKFNEKLLVKKKSQKETETWALVSYTPKNKTHKVATNITSFFKYQRKKHIKYC